MVVIPLKAWNPISPGDDRPGSPLSALAEPLTIARALVGGPQWREFHDSTLVVRLDPQPLLAVFGPCDLEERLSSLMTTLELVQSIGRYIGYAQAEEDCERLAGRLLERLGRRRLDDFYFTAIPRGGLIVLGMLSYALELQPRQLQPPPSAQRLVVVDDCSLSGNRFRRFLSECPGRQVVFAPLYSHPELRQNIERKEASVLACVSAQDLQDHAPERLGGQYGTWKQRWSERDREAYWIGQPDYLCFAWNEPDLAVWNPLKETIERGWRLFPAELCLKNRFPPPLSPAVRLQVQPPGRGTLRPSPAAVFCDSEEETIVANLESGRCISLSGTASAMWRSLVAHGEIGPVLADLEREFEADRRELERDLSGFIERLRQEGLLEKG